MIKPTQKALRQCAEWLSYCLRIGWPKSSLAELEALWWKYHNRRGDLVRPSDGSDVADELEAAVRERAVK